VTLGDKEHPIVDSFLVTPFPTFRLVLSQGTLLGARPSGTEYQYLIINV